MICEGDQLFLLLCLCDLCFFCVLSIILFLSLRVICDGKTLFLAMVSIIFHYLCFACFVVGSVTFLFI